MSGGDQPEFAKGFFGERRGFGCDGGHGYRLSRGCTESLHRVSRRVSPVNEVAQIQGFVSASSEPPPEYYVSPRQCTRGGWVSLPARAGSGLAWPAVRNFLPA